MCLLDVLDLVSVGIDMSEPGHASELPRPANIQRQVITWRNVLSWKGIRRFLKYFLIVYLLFAAMARCQMADSDIRDQGIFACGMARLDRSGNFERAELNFIPLGWKCVVKYRESDPHRPYFFVP